MEKILFTSIVVKSKITSGKITSGNSLDFLAQIDDLRLKCCVLKNNTKNKSSGRSPWESPSDQILNTRNK